MCGSIGENRGEMAQASFYDAGAVMNRIDPSSPEHLMLLRKFYYFVNMKVVSTCKLESLWGGRWLWLIRLLKPVGNLMLRLH